MDKKLRNKIKAMEEAKREEAMSSITMNMPETKTSFDEWWILFCKLQPQRPHLKEIVWADFQARGLSKSELPSAYSAAIKQFGL